MLQSLRVHDVAFLSSHVLFSPGKNSNDCYWHFAWPGISEALCDPAVKPYLEEASLPEEAYRIVQRQFAVLCHALDSATKMLLV